MTEIYPSVEDKSADRAKIGSDVAAFLAAGKSIELVPTGKSAYDDKPLKVSRTMIMGNSGITSSTWQPYERYTTTGGFGR